MFRAGLGLTSGTNDIAAQTDNFRGNVDWGRVGLSSGVGFASGIASSAAGAYSSSLVQGVSNKYVSTAITSSIASGAGHIAGNTTYNMFNGDNFDEAFLKSFNGIERSIGTGVIIGLGSRLGTDYALSTFFEGTVYTPKVLDQMRLDDYHGFPESVESFASSGSISILKGGDGIKRQVLRIPGEYKNHKGFFEFIKEPDSRINHRVFKSK